MMMMKAALVVCAAGLFFAAPASALEHTLEHWHSLNGMGRMQLVGDTKPSPALWYLEAQPRFRLDVPGPEEVVFRAAVGWEFAPRLMVFAGVGAIPAFDAPVWTIHETRLWQQIGYSDHFDDLTLSIRGRFEQRVFDDKDPALRARGLLRAAYKLSPVDEHLSIIVWDEGFVVADPALAGPYEAFDQNRLFAGIGYKFAPWFGIEAGYVNVIKGDPTKDNSQMRHVLALQSVVNLL